MSALFFRPRTEVKLSSGLVSIQYRSLFRQHENMTYSCCPLQRSSTDSEEYFVDILRTLTRQASLKTARCSVFADVKEARIKMVTLPRMNMRELRKLAIQPVFWQEYLGVAVSEWHLWWRRIPGFHTHEIRLLLVALPAEKANWYVDIIRRANLSLQTLSVACFEYFSYSRYLRHGGCLVMMVRDDPYLISAGSFGVRVQSFSSEEMRFISEESDNQASERLARIILKMLEGQSGDASIPIQIVTDPALNHQRFLSVAGLLPAKFQVVISSMEQFISLSADRNALFKDVGRTIHTVKIPAVVGIREKQTYRNPLLISMLLVFLGLSLYVHSAVSDRNKNLRVKIDYYRELAVVVEYKQRQLAEIQAESKQDRQLYAGMQSILFRQQQILQLLEIVAEALLSGLWLSKTEFHKTGLRIFGQSRSDEEIVRYVTALKQSTQVCETSIKQLLADDQTQMRNFVIECKLVNDKLNAHGT